MDVSAGPECACLNQLTLDTGGAGDKGVSQCVSRVRRWKFVRSLASSVKKTGGLGERGGRGEGEVQGEGRIAPPPGKLPSVGYNLTALSQDTCRAKTRHPTKTGACGDILVRAKPSNGPGAMPGTAHTHSHAHKHTHARLNA